MRNTATATLQQLEILVADEPVGLIAGLGLVFDKAIALSKDALLEGVHQSIALA